MEEILSAPPGLPHPTPTPSYWQLPPSNISTHRTTPTLPRKTDMLIIGSGISGATTALNLLQTNPSLSVTMLEARTAASGASGRNGGHTKHASYRKFSDDVAQVGVDDAVRIASLEFECMVAVHAFIREHSIDCDAVRCPTVDVYYDASQFAKAKRDVALMKEHIGSDSPVTEYVFYDADETARRFHVPGSAGCLVYPAGSLSAYRLTVGVLELALARGLNLQTNMPALAIQKLESGDVVDSDAGAEIDEDVRWKVLTPSGPIFARTVILATNGYTAHLLPQLQGVVVPFRGIVTAHRPGLSLPPLTHTYSFVYDSGYDYMISRPNPSAPTTQQGDIIIGGGLTKTPSQGISEFGTTDDSTPSMPASIQSYLRDSTGSFFAANWGGDNPEGRVRQTWSGIMGYSADGYPFVGPVPGEKGLFVDVSFQGHGMVLCFLCARAVAEMVLGEDGDGDGDEMVDGVDGKKLDEWFPACFRVGVERMGKRFNGLGHVPDVADDGDGDDDDDDDGSGQVNGREAGGIENGSI